MLRECAWWIWHNLVQEKQRIRHHSRWFWHMCGISASQIFRMPWAVIIISDYISIDASLFIKFRVSQVKVADLWEVGSWNEWCEFCLSVHNEIGCGDLDEVMPLGQRVSEGQTWVLINIEINVKYQGFNHVFSSWSCFLWFIVFCLH